MVDFPHLFVGQARRLDSRVDRASEILASLAPREFLRFENLPPIYFAPRRTP
jgi:hypothetical protein